MDFIRRVLGWSGEQRTVPSPLGFEPSMRQDSRATQTVLASLDIDAAINAHERWKARLMDYLEARSTEKMDLHVSDPPGPPQCVGPLAARRRRRHHGAPNSISAADGAPPIFSRAGGEHGRTRPAPCARPQCMYCT